MTRCSGSRTTSSCAPLFRLRRINMLNLNIDYPEWHIKAACNEPTVDPSWFFGIKGHRPVKALMLCNGDEQNKIPQCPVKDQCLKWILEFDAQQGFTSPGIYAGLGFKKRQSMRTCRNPKCSKKPTGRKMYCSNKCLEIYTRNRELRNEKYG